MSYELLVQQMTRIIGLLATTCFVCAQVKVEHPVLFCIFLETNKHEISPDLGSLLLFFCLLHKMKLSEQLDFCWKPKEIYHLRLVSSRSHRNTNGSSILRLFLDCFPAGGDDLTSAVTFMQPEVFLKLPSWFGGEIRFDFQTRQPDAVLLYQPEEQRKSGGSSGRLLNRWKDAQLYILLRKGNLSSNNGDKSPVNRHVFL